MDFTNISTEELVLEIARRKDKEIPEIVERINNDLKTLEMLGAEVVCQDDNCFGLDSIYIEDGSVFYRDRDR